MFRRTDEAFWDMTPEQFEALVEEHHRAHSQGKKKGPNLRAAGVIRKAAPKSSSKEESHG